MKNIMTIIRKEMARVFTDKGMLLSLFVLPPLTIILIYGLMGISAENETDKINEYVPTVYIVNSPENILFGENKNVEQFEKLVSASYSEITLKLENDILKIEELTKKVNNEEIDLLIVFNDAFENNIINKTNPEVSMYYNVNNTYSQNTFYKFQTILGAYSDSLLNNRIDNPNLLQVFYTTTIQKGDVEKAQGQMISMILPMLIVIYLMAGAMGVGMESIAGEKERGTIATLLVTPIKRSELAIGKIISISIIGLLSTLASFLGLVGILPTFAKISGETDGAGLSPTYGPMDYIMLLTIMLVAVLLFVTLIVIISAYSKSVKQAGSLVMPVYLLVVGAAMFNMFNQTVDESFVPYTIPIFNIVLSLKAVFSFDLLITNWLITIVTTVIYTLVLIFIIQKMFRSEKIMFNK
ncbi:MAG: family transporter protein [Haloplasmataceae bacterium]|jgi:sodium transport system permease protein|nr:family transporter protein [Haloplasmataceae bacterium]